MRAATLAGPSGAWARPLRRALVAIAALVAVAALLWLLSALLGLGAAPPPSPRNPFGTGLREAAPAATGIGGYILSIQANFYRSLQATLSALKADGSALPALLAAGFLYGVFHAAGPGHGKAVVSGYLLATHRTLRRGLVLSLAAALLQAAVAVAIVTVLRFLLNATAVAVNATAQGIELASFVLLALFGLSLLWRKTASFVPTSAPHVFGSDGSCETCGHSHAPSATTVQRATTWRESAGVVLAAGLRPCSGAVILLVLAASQGLFAAGVAATLAMALGTALTTGGLAALAVYAKRIALSVASGRGEGGALAIAIGELCAAAFVALVGLVLVLGLWSGAGA